MALYCFQLAQLKYKYYMCSELLTVLGLNALNCDESAAPADITPSLHAYFTCRCCLRRWFHLLFSFPQCT